MPDCMMYLTNPKASNNFSQRAIGKQRNEHTKTRMAIEQIELGRVESRKVVQYPATCICTKVKKRGGRSHSHGSPCIDC